MVAQDKTGNNNKNDQFPQQNLDEEFKQFVYIVSHDLKAPFRHIQQATSLLLKKLGNKLEDDERRCAEIIENSVVQCQNMMDALTAYSRLNTQAQIFSRVDCNEIIETVIEALQLSIQETKAVLSIESLPCVLADKAQLKLLFRHLLENALKFHQEGEPPKITVKATSQEDGWIFTIVDNGEGIEAKYQDRIFEMFFQIDPALPRADIGKGIGAGLAICKKIVNRHGGCIAVEKAQGGGSVFSFRISNALEENTTLV